jgi:hypothetical protein
MTTAIAKLSENIVTSYYRAEETYYQSLEKLVDGVSWLK